MAAKRPENLDDRLRQWAAEQAPSAERLDQLQARIVEQLGAVDTTVLPEPRHRRAGRVAWFSCGAAVAVMLCWGMLWLTRGRPEPWPGPVPSEASVPPEFAWLQKSQLHGKGVLLKEVERMFGDRLAWIAETQGRVSFGLTADKSADETEHEPSGKPLAVRLVVVKRQPGAKQSEPVWAVDVLARSEQVVQLSPEQASGAELVVWAYSLPDGKIAVDTNLALRGAAEVATSSSGLQNSGVPTGVGKMRLGSVEYEVFQTVAVLNDVQ